MNVTDRRTDRQTHRHRMTAKPALDASIARQKCQSVAGTECRQSVVIIIIIIKEQIKVT